MNGFFITVNNGLLEGDHRKRMGSAVWEFMWLLDKITSVSEEGIGKVLGGRPIKLKEFGTGIVEPNISLNLTKLTEEGYINVIHAPYGLVITVNKARKIFNQKSDKRFTENIKPHNENIKPHNENIKPNKTRQLDKTLDKTSIDKSIQKKSFSVGNPDINEIASYFLYKLQIPKEDISFKDSRIYWSHLLKASRTGKQGVKWLIDIASEDEFWKNNITSSKNLYYNRIKLITRLRGKTTNGKSAFYTEGGDNVTIQSG
jgi:hypothetical protein